MKDGKDGPEGAKLTSRLEVVGLGFDDEGDEISSCVVVPVMPAVGETVTAPRAWDKGAKAPKGSAKIAHEALFETIGDRGIIPPPDPHIPAGRKCAKLSDWEVQAYRRGVCASINDRSKQRAFERAVEKLIAAHNVATWKEYVWIISI